MRLHFAFGVVDQPFVDDAVDLCLGIEPVEMARQAEIVPIEGRQSIYGPKRS